jgi:mitochondrial chaperone BCS1
MASLFLFTSVLQPLFALLTSTAETTAIPNASFTNATQNVTASTGPLQIQSDFSSLIAFISSFSGDYLKFIVLGGAFEALRRLYSASYMSLMDRFFITATFESGDFAFGEISFPHGLSPSWPRFRVDDVLAIFSSSVAPLSGLYSQHLWF